MADIASRQLLIVTTPAVPGWEVDRVYGLVTGESVFAAGPLRDLAAAFETAIGGASPAVARLIADARERALLEIRRQAQALGANAIVGASIGYESMGPGQTALVSVRGTAVRLRSDHGDYQPETATPDGDLAERPCPACGTTIPRLELTCVHCGAPRPAADR